MFKNQRRRPAPAPSKVCCSFPKCATFNSVEFSGQNAPPDKEWFASHPEADLRIRDAFPGELDEETAGLFQIGVTRTGLARGELAYIRRGVFR